MQMTQTQFASLSADVQAQLTAAGIQVIPDGQPVQSSFQPQPMQPTQGMVWAQPTPAVNVSGWDSVSVPISVDTSKGECTIHLDFSGVRTPDDVSALVKMLVDRGFPVKTWQKKNSGFSAK